MRVEYETIRDGHAEWEAWPRGDLKIYLDGEGRVLRIERHGDDVRFRDLLDVIEVLVMPEESEEP